jgi:hypothetical protein
MANPFIGLAERIHDVLPTEDSIHTMHGETSLQSMPIPSDNVTISVLCPLAKNRALLLGRGRKASVLPEIESSSIAILSQ